MKQLILRTNASLCPLYARKDARRNQLSLDAYPICAILLRSPKSEPAFSNLNCRANDAQRCDNGRGTFRSYSFVTRNNGREMATQTNVDGESAARGRRGRRRCGRTSVPPLSVGSSPSSPCFLVLLSRRASQIASSLSSRVELSLFSLCFPFSFLTERNWKKGDARGMLLCPSRRRRRRLYVRLDTLQPDSEALCQGACFSLGNVAANQFIPGEVRTCLVWLLQRRSNLCTHSGQDGLRGGSARGILSDYAMGPDDATKTVPQIGRYISFVFRLHDDVLR